MMPNGTQIVDHGLAISSTLESLTKLLADCRTLLSEECSAHVGVVTANDDNGPPTNDKFRDTGCLCPHDGCDREKPFFDVRLLRRHFMSHLTCDKAEVCVFCHEVFRRPAAYIRHYNGHHSHEDDETKVAYTDAIILRLQNRAQTQMNMAFQDRETKSPQDRENAPNGQLMTARKDNTGHDTSISGDLTNPRKRRHIDVLDTEMRPPLSSEGSPTTQPTVEHRQHVSVTSRSGMEQDHRYSSMPSHVPEWVGLPSRPVLARSDSNSSTEGRRATRAKAGTSIQHWDEAWLATQRNAAIACYPYTAMGRTAALLQQMVEHPPPLEKNAVIQDLLRELAPHQIEDLHRVMFEPEPIGVERQHLQRFWNDLWDCLQSSTTYCLEEALGLSRSACTFMEVDSDGDFVVFYQDLPRRVELDATPRLNVSSPLLYNSWPPTP
ncbi:hypothetical protein PCL_07061 [Purpureocillium lilacinum]|uniref:C2H2-type domain-containing protein n=1 Tax=Purpureocillium lilacinum TaxID=33203 RepID=A0A2U3DT83_PURLI|nr:hypothetical protein PCL_07061 [Purpureocillium lilacinum]